MKHTCTKEKSKSTTKFPLRWFSLYYMPRRGLSSTVSFFSSGLLSKDPGQSFANCYPGSSTAKTKLLGPLLCPTAEPVDDGGLEDQAESLDYLERDGESLPRLPPTPEWLSWLPHAASFPPNDAIAWDQIPRCYHKKFTHVHFTSKGSSVSHVIYINVPSAITRTATPKSKNFNPAPEDYRFLKHLLVLSW